MSKNRPFKFKLMQEGMCVAAVESCDREQAEQAIKHYALIYSQDGPVEIVEVPYRCNKKNK